MSEQERLVQEQEGVTVTQERVNKVRGLYETNQPEGIGPLPELHSASTQLITNPDRNEETGADKEIYLASVSKIAWAYFLLRELFGGKGKAQQLTCDFTVIQELIGNSEGRGRHPLGIFLDRAINQTYLPALEEMVRVLSTNESPLLNRTFGKRLRQIIEKEFLQNSDREQLLGIIREVDKETSQKITFSLPAKEVTHLALNLSSNTIITMMNAHLLNEYGSYKKVRKQLQEIVPSFKNTYDSRENLHWVQPDANIGSLADFARFVMYLYNNRDNDPIAAQVLNGMRGTPDFGHDFTNSALGKKLQLQGWKIYEKTGYVPLQNWSEALAQDGWPAHMIAETVVLLVPPEGVNIEPFAVCGHRAYALPSLEDITTENGVDFPTLSKNQRDVISTFFRTHAGPSLRNNISAEVSDHLGSLNYAQLVN